MDDVSNLRHFCNKVSFIVCYIFLDSSMVEHTAVNRGVVGSSPTRGVCVLYVIIAHSEAPWSSG